MTLGTAASLVFAWVVAICSPGPDLLMILQQTAPKKTEENSGPGPRQRGVAAALGVMSGNLGWMVLAAVGLGALVSLVPGVIASLKIVGGLFLLWMGLSGLWALRRTAGGSGPTVVARRNSLKRSYLRGLGTNLANPKAIIFFTALFAPFFSHGVPVWQTVALLATLWLIGIAWFCFFAVLTSSAAVTRWVQKYWVTVEIVTSVLFALIGLGFVVDGILGF